MSHLNQSKPKPVVSATKKAASCPCGLETSYETCCGQYISGEVPAPTPEALMRSRYTAYTVERVDYLRETQDPKTQDSFDHAAAAEWAANATWIELEVFSADPPAEDVGFVEFAAHYLEEGRTRRHHERSRFERIDGRWYYVEGIFLGEPVQAKTRIGRNDPCPCGSGKKYKQCCGRAN